MKLRMSPHDLGRLVSERTHLFNETALLPQAKLDGAVSAPVSAFRLRFINGRRPIPVYDVALPGLELTVTPVQADWHKCWPVTEMSSGWPRRKLTTFCATKKDGRLHHPMPKPGNRTGYRARTLATHAGLEAPVPALDPVEWLTMGDHDWCHGWRAWQG